MLPYTIPNGRKFMKSMQFLLSYISASNAVFQACQPHLQIRRNTFFGSFQNFFKRKSFSLVHLGSFCCHINRRSAPGLRDSAPKSIKCCDHYNSSQDNQPLFFTHGFFLPIFKNLCKGKVFLSSYLVIQQNLVFLQPLKSESYTLPDGVTA